MKRMAILIVAGLLAFSYNSTAQKVQKSPKAVVSQVVGLTEITVTYYRPGLKGRDMATLAKPGNVWRTGANNATEFKIANAITIGGKELAAGTYSLYKIPGDVEWTIIFNSKLSWGTQYDEGSDVMRVQAKASKTADTTETFTINISDIDANGKDANLDLRWGNVGVKVPFTVSK